MKPFASSYDNLKFANDKDVKKVVNNEEIYFSHEVIKINSKNDIFLLNFKNFIQ